jgi:predicted nucleic acid-binding protein
VVIYPDTSFLVSLYIDELNSEAGQTYADTLAEPLTFTAFHRLEFRTALRGRVFRKNLSDDELRQALRLSDKHLVEGFLRHTPFIWSDALREAERLGEAYVVETGVRSGDLFHVASAVVLGAREFVTFDQRQTALARRAGLKVKAWRSTK